MVTQTVRDSNSIDASKIKVKVKNDSGRYIITSSHPPGPAVSVAAYLDDPKKQKRVFSLAESYGYELQQCIERCGSLISPDEWAHAIAAEIFCRLGQSPEADVELSSIGSGGYMALDSGVYKMIPVQSANHSKLFGALRRKITDQAKSQADKTVALAQQQADKIVESASDKMIEANRKLAEVTAAVGVIPPQWAVSGGFPLRTYLNGSSGVRMWCIGFWVSVQLTEFYYKWDAGVRGRSHIYPVKYWAANRSPEIKPCKALFWAPVDEKMQLYTRNIFIDGSFHVWPHINHSKSCMELADAPKVLKGSTDLGSLANSFTRCMSKVELNSLLAASTNWPPEFHAAMPTIIRDWVDGGNYAALASASIPATRSENIDAVEDAASTWTAVISPDFTTSRD